MPTLNWTSIFADRASVWLSSNPYQKHEMRAKKSTTRKKQSRMLLKRLLNDLKISRKG
jgi:hypothetical protein